MSQLTIKRLLSELMKKLCVEISSNSACHSPLVYEIDLIAYLITPENGLVPLFMDTFINNWSHVLQFFILDFEDTKVTSQSSQLCYWRANRFKIQISKSPSFYHIQE